MGNRTGRDARIARGATYFSRRRNSYMYNVCNSRCVVISPRWISFTALPNLGNLEMPHSNFLLAELGAHFPLRLWGATKLTRLAGPALAHGEFMAE